MARHFPHWLEAFVKYASYGEAPLSMYFWAGVSAVAGALRRRVWIDMGYFKWIPNFYIVLVAPPGIVSKTTTASIGMKLLRKVPNIKFGPDVVTWPALASAFAASLEHVELSPGNFTPMCSLTLESGEFGTLLNPQDREMVDMLVSLWDGKDGAFHKLTKTQGEDLIENPFINIIACTTPAWIEGYFPEYLIGGGFTSRSIFVYADTKRQYVAYPGLTTPEDFDRVSLQLVDDLTEISKLKGVFTIHPDAIIWGEKWYKSHYANKPKHLDNDRFGGYLARKQTHIHKLAMILSVSQNSSLILTKKDLVEASECIDHIELEMPKVFERIGVGEHARGQSLIVSTLNTYKKLPYVELWKLLYRRLSMDEFNHALAAAETANYVYRAVGDDGQLWIHQKGNDHGAAPV